MQVQKTVSRTNQGISSPVKKKRRYHYWKPAEVAKIARKFSLRTQFFKANQRAYQYARRKGILDIVCKHMKDGRHLRKLRNLQKRQERIKNTTRALEALTKSGKLHEIARYMDSEEAKKAAEERIRRRIEERRSDPKYQEEHEKLMNKMFEKYGADTFVRSPDDTEEDKRRKYNKVELPIVAKKYEAYEKLFEGKNIVDKNKIVLDNIGDFANVVAAKTILDNFEVYGHMPLSAMKAALLNKIYFRAFCIVYGKLDEEGMKYVLHHMMKMGLKFTEAEYIHLLTKGITEEEKLEALKVLKKEWEEKAEKIEYTKKALKTLQIKVMEKVLDKSKTNLDIDIDEETKKMLMRYTEQMKKQPERFDMSTVLNFQDEKLGIFESYDDEEEE